LTILITSNFSFTRLLLP